MGTPKNTILLNNKLYDSKSGKLISVQGTQSLDGVVVPKKAQSTPKTVAKRAEALRKEVKHQAHHKPQHSKTLMRSGVAKPKAVKHVSSHPQLLPIGLSSERIKRASQIGKSKLISRFGADIMPSHGHIKKTAPLEVKTPPANAEIINHHESPVVDASGVSAFSPQATAFISRTKEQNKPSKAKKERRFGLRGRKLGASKIAAVAVSVAVIGGFVVWQNMPKLEMHLASSRAKIAAKLPDYKPSGYSFKGVSTGQGAVTASYKSNSDDRTYTVKQQSLNTTDAASSGNHVAGDSTTAQVIQKQGKTIYIYGSGGASWVASGLQYQIESNNSLTTDQILKIADSL